MNYEVTLADDARENLSKLDKPIRERIIKRIARMRSEPSGRHFTGGLDYFVEEAGQHRIAYKCYENENRKVVYFIGDQKQYEKWYSGG